MNKMRKCRTNENSTNKSFNNIPGEKIKAVVTRTSI